MGFVANVRDYGAVGDGKTDDTEAFETALAAIASQGGGRLVVEGRTSPTLAGKYLLRPIYLTSHLDVVLGANVSLLGIMDEDAWPLIPPLPSYGKGRDGGDFRHGSLLQGHSVENVTIHGDRTSSIINGQGWYWWEKVRNGTTRYNPGHLIEFMYSSQIRIHNLRMINSPSWNNHFFDCDRVHVKEVDIWAPESSPFTDGWDPDSSRNVLIEDSTYAAGDDCVAIKSGWDCFGRSVTSDIRHFILHHSPTFASQSAAQELTTADRRSILPCATSPAMVSRRVSPSDRK
jgi:polygalacturonase